MRNGWERKRIAEIAQHSLGKMLDKAKNRGEPRPYLRNLNVRWFDFELSELLEMRFLPEGKSATTSEKAISSSAKADTRGERPFGKATSRSISKRRFIASASMSLRTQSGASTTFCFATSKERSRSTSTARGFSTSRVSAQSVRASSTSARRPAPIVKILDEAFASIAPPKPTPNKTAKTPALSSKATPRNLCFAPGIHQAGGTRLGHQRRRSLAAAKVTDWHPVHYDFRHREAHARDRLQQHVHRSREYFDALKPNRRPKKDDVLYTVTGATLGVPCSSQPTANSAFSDTSVWCARKRIPTAGGFANALLSPQCFQQATVGSTVQPRKPFLSVSAR